MKNFHLLTLNSKAILCIFLLQFAIIFFERIKIKNILANFMYNVKNTTNLIYIIIK